MQPYLIQFQDTFVCLISLQNISTEMTHVKYVTLIRNSKLQIVMQAIKKKIRKRLYLLKSR